MFSFEHDKNKEETAVSPSPLKNTINSELSKSSTFNPQFKKRTQNGLPDRLRNKIKSSSSINPSIVQNETHPIQLLSFSRFTGFGRLNLLGSYTKQEKRLIEKENQAVTLINKLHNYVFPFSSSDESSATKNLEADLGEFSTQIQRIRTATYSEDAYQNVEDELDKIIIKLRLMAASDPNAEYNALFEELQRNVQGTATLEDTRTRLLAAQGGQTWTPASLPQGFVGNYRAKQDWLAATNKPIEDKYTTISEKANPHPDLRENSFGYWFNNFYLLIRKSAEIKTRGVYYCKKMFTPDGRPRALNHAQMRAILTEMMGEYMESFGASGPLGPMLREADPQSNSSFLSDDGQAGIAFRGDSRPLRTIQDQGGQTSKADVPVLRQRYGMDEPWHPFSDLAVSNQAYYRKGMQDNDLFTVVSIALAFIDATKFPLVEETKDKVKRNNHWETDITIYVLYVSDGFNTFAKQKRDQSTYGKGEFATRTIPFDQHLASIKVHRTHFGNEGNAGHRAQITDISFLNVARGKQLLGDNAYARMVTWVRDIRNEDHEYRPG